MNLESQQFKNKVLEWLLSEGIIINKKVRVYNSRRYGMEVRIYNEPMDFLNSKSSFRRSKVSKRDKDGNVISYEGTRGIHSRKIATYIHVNEEDLKSEDEKDYIIEMLK